MGEFTVLPSPTTTSEKHKRLMISSSLSGTPMSPTSTLDTKPFSVLRNDTKPGKRHWIDPSRGIGLAALESDADGSEPDDPSQPNKMVLFGSHLKIQIPPVFYAAGSPRSADFGTRTKNSHVGFFSARGSGPGSGVFSGSISVTDMELSEDYTCVITHGPNPKTTHIFDDCVVQSCCGIMGISTNNNNNNNSNNDKVNGNNDDRISSNIGLSSENFLSSCFTCNKNLDQGKDIYMYRGEKAFCSEECRYEEMSLDEKGLSKNKIGI